MRNQTSGETALYPLDEPVNGNNFRAGRMLLPDTGDSFEMWLNVETSSGCVEWDSRNGANYQFAMRPWNTAVLHFAGDWTQSVENDLQSATVLTVDYDLSRLAACRGSSDGAPQWSTKVHARFDNGAIAFDHVAALVTGNGEPTMVPTLGRIPVPASATSVELWFENSDASGCRAYDSNYGRNYRYDL